MTHATNNQHEEKFPNEILRDGLERGMQTLTQMESEFADNPELTSAIAEAKSSMEALRQKTQSTP